MKGCFQRHKRRVDKHTEDLHERQSGDESDCNERFQNMKGCFNEIKGCCKRTSCMTHNAPTSAIRRRFMRFRGLATNVREIEVFQHIKEAAQHRFSQDKAAMQDIIS